MLRLESEKFAASLIHANQLARPINGMKKAALLFIISVIIAVVSAKKSTRLYAKAKPHRFASSFAVSSHWQRNARKKCHIITNKMINFVSHRKSLAACRKDALT